MIVRINSAMRYVPAWTLYIMGALPPVVLFWLAVQGHLDPDPIAAMEHWLGDLTIQFLILGLAITPLRKITGLNLVRYRRAIGLITFYFLCAHILVWLVLDLQFLSEIGKALSKQPYIIVGMLAFLGMVPLALTSNNWSMRKLKLRWGKLHKLVYPVAILGAVHGIMVQKVWEFQESVYLVVILLLLGWRFFDSFVNRRLNR